VDLALGALHLVHLGGLHVKSLLFLGVFATYLNIQALQFTLLDCLSLVLVDQVDEPLLLVLQFIFGGLLFMVKVIFLSLELA
jgi:hypothetical protein